MRNIMINCFEESKLKQILISIFDDKDNVEDYHIGFVIEIFENSILIQTYDAYGNNDGLVLIRFIDIFKVEKETEYHKKMLSIITNQIRSNEKQFDFIIDKKDNDGIHNVIVHCKNNNILLTIKLIYAYYITGFIFQYDNQILQIKTYSKYGKYLGDTFIKFEDIMGIAYGRQEEIFTNKLI